MAKTEIRGNQILDNSITEVDVGFSGATIMNNVSPGDTFLVLDNNSNNLGVKRLAVSTISESLRSNNSITCGGVISVNNIGGTGYVYWGDRFRIISNGKGVNFSIDGYFDITCPTNSTILGVGGASNVTTTGNGIPLSPWQSLYYILPIGSGYVTNINNFRVAGYTSNIDIPHDWIQICTYNGTNNIYYFPQGIKLKIGETIDLSINDSLNADKLDGNHATYFVSTGRTVTAGSGLTGGGNLSNNITISHADTSSSSGISSDNSNGVVIQDITVSLDGFGHVTGATVGTANLDSRYLQTGATAVYTNDADKLDGFHGTYYVNTGRTITSGVGLTGGGDLSGNITISHDDTSSASNISSDNSNGVVIQDITVALDGFGHVTGATVGTADLDGRYYTETEADNRFVNVAGDTMTGALIVNNNLTVTGTSSFGVIQTSSSTLVTNLNADLLDGKHSSDFSITGHTHTKANITDFPASMPASDVYAWAKAATKPTYNFSEITSKPTTIAGYGITDASLSNHTHYQLYQPNGVNPFVYTDNASNLFVNGNIIQSGTTWETHANKIFTSGDTMILRDGAVSGLAANKYVGLVAKKYDGVNDGVLVFDNNGVARVGDMDTVNWTGTTQALATREDAPLSNGFAYWDNATSKFKTALASTLSVSNSDLLDNQHGAYYLDYNNFTNKPILNYLSINGGTITGNLTANSFIKSGGNSTQFLMADGSVDTYGTVAGSVAEGNHTHTKANITDFAHNHTIADVTALQSTLDGKSSTGHTHTFASLTSKPTTIAGYGITDAILLNDVIQNTNPFGGRKLYINSLDNALAGASKKYYVTVTVHKKVVNSVTYPKAINAGDITLPQWEDSPVIDTRDGTGLFDNNYEGGMAINSDEYLKVTLNFSTDGTAYFTGYPYGKYYLSYYYASTPEKAQVRQYNGFAPHTIGYKTYDFYDYIGTNANDNFIQQCDGGPDYQRRQIEFIIFGHPSHVTSLTEIEWKLDRPTFATHSPLFTNYDTNKSYQIFNFGSQTANNVIINPNGNITASSFVKSGGTATQFLMADGSIDTYGTTAGTVAEGNHTHALNQLTNTGHTHTKANITDFPISMPASDVYAWAKSATKPSYSLSELTSTGHTHTKANITDFPASMPASDVYAWAKDATKPTYNFSEIGSKPTTLAGYGITAADTMLRIFLPLSGGTMYGDLHIRTGGLSNLYLGDENLVIYQDDLTGDSGIESGGFSLKNIGYKGHLTVDIATARERSTCPIYELGNGWDFRAVGSELQVFYNGVKEGAFAEAEFISTGEGYFNGNITANSFIKSSGTATQFLMADGSIDTYGTTAGTVAEGNHTHAFASLISKPTTLAGYGITDASLTGHTHTKSEVGLANVDNTSDANKPVSTATQTALNGKLPLSGGNITGDLMIFNYINGLSNLYLGDSSLVIYQDDLTGDAGIYSGNFELKTVGSENRSYLTVDNVTARERSTCPIYELGNGWDFRAVDSELQIFYSSVKKGAFTETGFMSTGEGNFTKTTVNDDYCYTGDKTHYIQNLSSGDIAFKLWNGSSDVVPLTVKDSGNVGIGTATPNSAYKLDVVGTVNASISSRAPKFDVGNGWDFRAVGSELQIFYNNVKKFTFNTDGFISEGEVTALYNNIH